MSVRHLVYGLVSGDPALQGVYDDRIIDAGALGGVDGIAPAFPFLAVRYGEVSPGPRRTVEDLLVEFWSYDEPQDYTRTGKGLAALHALLHDRSGGSVLVDGVTTWLISATWTGTSRDLSDDVLRASVRYATYRLITNT